MRANKPEGWQHVIPRLFAADPEKLVLFIKEVFGAKGDFHQQRPTELKIGDSIIMVSGSEIRGEYPACLYVYVDNVEDRFKRAKSNNIDVIEEPLLTPYGDKRAVIKDYWGNMWQIAEYNPN